MNIVLEGFWGIGKSTVGEALKDSHGYTFIPEPRRHQAEQPPEHPSLWYRDRYQEITDDLCNGAYSPPIVMERSIISTISFAHTHNTEAEFAYDVFEQFKNWYRHNDCIIVFLYADPHTLVNARNNDTDPSLVVDYQSFYTHTLPYTYNMPVLPINQFHNEIRKDPQTIIHDIMRAMEERRVAQVNVMVFRRNAHNDIEVLILKRKAQKGGFWQTISGGIGPSELVSEGAFRELQEEIGIEADKERLSPVHYRFSFVGSEGYELNEYVYTYELEDDEPIHISEEHVEHAFLPVSDAKTKVEYEHNRTILEQAFE